MKPKVFQTVVWKEGKYFVAQCLNVDISSFGDSKEDAIKNLDEALSLYFEDSEQQNFSKVENPELVSLPLKRA